MSDISTDPGDQRRALLSLYDEGVGEVYGYLLARVGSPTVAEDLTAETFLAAVDAVRAHKVRDLTMAWLIGVARHKLVDHWRRREREDRLLHSVANDAAVDTAVFDAWDVRLDVMRAHEVLTRLGAHHRSALTLRYLDALPVREVADSLGRTVGATEVLLVRARAAFRDLYEADRDDEESEAR